MGNTTRSYLLKGLALSSLLVAMACGQDPSFTELESSRRSSDASRGSATDEGTIVAGTQPDNPEGVPPTAIGGVGDPTDSGDPMLDEEGNPIDVTAPDGGSDVPLPGEDNDWAPDWEDDPAGEDGMGDSDGMGDGMADGGGDGMADGGGDGMSDGMGGGDNPMPEVPGADPDDMGDLQRCLANWMEDPETFPFGNTINNYRKISASVTVGGFGNAVNDTDATAEPFLTLIDAGVNVFGAPTYQLLNPNGYYCMKVNVNVSTDLTINLHCTARLSDSRVNVNVGSNQNNTTAGVGVHVLSDVSVNNIRPDGDACVR